MDKDQKLIAFLDSLGPDADVEFAQQLLQAHDWNLQAALETVTGGAAAQAEPHPADTRPPMRTGYVDRLLDSGHSEDDEAIALAQSEAAAVQEATARQDLERALLESQQAFLQQAEIEEQAALAQAIEASSVSCASVSSGPSRPGNGPKLPRPTQAYPSQPGNPRSPPAADSGPPAGPVRSEHSSSSQRSRLSKASQPEAPRRLQPSRPSLSSSESTAASSGQTPPKPPARSAVKEVQRPLPPQAKMMPARPKAKESTAIPASVPKPRQAMEQIPAKQRPAKSLQQQEEQQAPKPQQRLPEKASVNERRPNLASRCLGKLCASGKPDPRKAKSGPQDPAGRPKATAPGRPTGAETSSTTRASCTSAAKEQQPLGASGATRQAEPGNAPCPAGAMSREEGDLQREREEAEMRRKDLEGERREPDPVVSALQALRRLHMKRDPVALVTCLQTLHAYIGNLAKNPQESRYHSINCQNGNFRSRVASLEGGTAVLEACGFVASGDKLCVDRDFIKSKGPKLWDALSKVAVLLEQAQGVQVNPLGTSV